MPVYAQGRNDISFPCLTTRDALWWDAKCLESFHMQENSSYDKVVSFSGEDSCSLSEVFSLECNNTKAYVNHGNNSNIQARSLGTITQILIDVKHEHQWTRTDFFKSDLQLTWVSFQRNKLRPSCVSISWNSISFVSLRCWQQHIRSPIYVNSTLHLPHTLITHSITFIC